MTWISHTWWRYVFNFYRLLGLDDWIDAHWERQGMRRAIGGRWGRWEVKLGRWELFKVWWPSPCEHYPPPPCVTSTEPLEIEEWL